MFVCSARNIAYQLYQELEELRPDWFTVVNSLDKNDNSQSMSESERKRAINEGRIAAPSEKVKMVMTRGKDDVERLYNLLGGKDERKELENSLKTPDNSPGDFTKLRGGQGFKDNETGTIMQRSTSDHTNKLADGGEFKAGVKPGQTPTTSRKITISGGKEGGCVLKKDGC